MRNLEEVRAKIKERLATHRSKLEVVGMSELDSHTLRGRIAELNELLTSLDNPTKPDWNYSSALDE